MRTEDFERFFQMISDDGLFVEEVIFVFFSETATSFFTALIFAGAFLVLTAFLAADFAAFEVVVLTGFLLSTFGIE